MGTIPSGGSSFMNPGVLAALPEGGSILPADLPQAASSAVLASPTTGGPPHGEGHLAADTTLGRTAATAAAGGAGSGSNDNNLPMERCLATASEMTPDGAPTSPDPFNHLPKQHRPLLVQQQASAAAPPLAWHEVEALPFVDPITKETVSHQW